MERQELLEILALGVTRGEISEESADAVLNLFDERVSFSSIPDTYAEIDYGDRDDSEAADGMRFDDMNLLRYRER